MKKDDPTIKWYERKRTFLGLPWSFTKYAITNEKFIMDTGFFNLEEQEVRLYRILNMHLKKSLGQRMFGLGTIHVDANDKDLDCFDIVNIKNSDEVMSMLSEQVEKERNRNRVYARENMGGPSHDEMDEHYPDDQEDDFEDN
ncbi:MAG: PH domain-containing protein [Lachnospiraceae bacterium]|nr:PH domain-containing protein [Lachnospiraceae bacterium]